MKFAPLAKPARFLGALLFVLTLALPVLAQEGAKVVELEVRGAKSVAQETILAKVQTKPGSAYQDAVVSEDIRRIFALGYFTDVRTEVQQLLGGLRLVFIVQEKPTLSEIRFEGNRFLRKPRLAELFGLKSGELYDPRKVKQGADLIKAEYSRKGFSESEVVTRVETDEASNRARLYVLIDEGPRMRVKRILMEGNQAFSDKRLRKVLKTKKRFWFAPGTYDPQVVEEDLERLRAFYRKHGYQDIAAAYQVYRDPSGRGLVLHFTVNEGLQHRVGQVVLDGVALFPEREIRTLIRLKPGSVFSDEGIQEDLRLIKQYYGDRGYIHAEVTADPQLDDATKRVNLAYHVRENDLVYVHRIDVRGNLRTKDTVVRRELRIHPGEAFNGAKIRKSLDRLYNLGYFEEVNVETEATETPDHEDLIVQVKETKTGSFSFGGGFSSVDRLIGLVEVEQRNFDWRNFPHFTGAGQDLRFRAEVGSVRRFFDLSFTEPWLMGHPVSFGLDLYNRTRLRSSSLGLGFEEEQRGGGLRFGREFADWINMGLSYQLFRTDISDVVEEASADLKAEQGRNTISMVGTSVSWDRRDNRFDPTKGWFTFASGDLAGGVFGADKDFYRLQAGASSYLPHLDRLVLELRLRTGIVEAYSGTSEVPIFERFFGGGSGTIRGFRERRVGPRDPSSNDPIGGEATLVGTLEEVLTIVKDERGRPILKGTVFLDVGDVWRRVGDYAESFKSGAGIGARVNTPIGPVRLDLGIPLNEIPDEKRKPRFHFNISRSF
ncbi:MAG: outer membrane protein assembly factor BamA [Candidatus Omnitrophica bacterium]|nr:outer membrane protein assembly factor BamA [Candidatus Omnitrophota bacterium]